jgi:predicted RNA methylase
VNLKASSEMTLQDLQGKLSRLGWTPGKRDISALLSHWRALTDDERSALEKRIVKVDPPCAVKASQLFSGLDDRSRGDLCRPLLKAFLSGFDVVADPEAFPLECLRDDSSRVRKAAAQALGSSWNMINPKFRDVFVDAMVANLRVAREQSEIKALVEALGKSGRERALQALEAIAADDSLQLDMESLPAALLTARRDVTRAATHDDYCQPDRLTGAGVLLYFTPGLEQVARMRPPFLESEVMDQGLLFAAGVSWGAIAENGLWREAGIVLGDWDQRSADSLARMVFVHREEIAAATVMGQGPIRMRLGREDGRGRSFVWEFAAALERLGPQMMNDGRGAHWELRTIGSTVVLVPLKYADLRYPWRDVNVEGASDPTIAQALVQLAYLRPGESVYDPFCGAGTELILAARTEPAAELFGSEINADVAALAREAAHRAGVRLNIHVADALRFDGGPFDVILTNPPFGMRTVRGGARELLAEFLLVAGRRLTKTGRIVMLSHAPRSTREWAEAGEMRLTRSFPLRLGGMGCEIQVFTPIR